MIGFGPGLDLDPDLPGVRIRSARVDPASQQIAKHRAQLAHRFLARALRTQQLALEHVVEAGRHLTLRLLQFLSECFEIALIRGIRLPDGVDDVQLKGIRVLVVRLNHERHLGPGDDRALLDPVGHQQDAAAHPFPEGLLDVAFDYSGLEVPDVTPGYDSPGTQIGFDEIGVTGTALVTVRDEDGAVRPPPGSWSRHRVSPFGRITEPLADGEAVVAHPLG